MKVVMIKNCRIIYICIVLISCTSYKLTAQDFPVNGTKTTLEFIDSLRYNLDEENKFRFNTNEITLQLQFYKIANDSGFYKVQNQQIRGQLDTINNYFAPAYLQFQISNIDSIPDYNYAFVDSTVLDELTLMYQKRHTINIYLVKELHFDTVQYGFTFLPTSINKDFIFLQEEFLKGNYLSTLLGSYFGLLPTHEKKAGMSYVDGSNCHDAGDLICDTYADPDLRGLVSKGCVYQGNTTDPHGNYYIPTVANIMSNSLDLCKCKFTEGQLKRIIFNYWKYRDYLK